MIKPHQENVRLYCTMIRHGSGNFDDIAINSSAAGLTAASNGSQVTTSSYTLYMEHLGGFLPLLKGKKVCKIRPEFVIFDPQLNEQETCNWYNLPTTTYNLNKKLDNALANDVSEADHDDDFRSPRTRRRRRRNNR